jgi:peptidoglycan/xylan/chitin deacetylase (PgdA/CDA1 family)
LESGLKGYTTVVLPSALCLSNKEKASIQELLGAGGGVICTWATGVRNETGQWQGLAYLTALTGADSFKFSTRPSPWFVSFLAARPTTAGTPVGRRLQVASPERMEATSLSVDAYWSDSRFQPVDLNQPTNFQGAAMHNQLRSGRVVWLGFQENSAVAEGNGQTILDSFLINSLAWAGQKALCSIDDWPWGYATSVLLAMDVEDEYENAAGVAEALLKNHARGTFFSVADLLKKDPGLAKFIVRAGEIASHGDTHRDFNEPSVTHQFFRLASSRWTIRRLAKTWVMGFHPPGDSLDRRTFQALTGAGFRYYLTNENRDAALPAILEVSPSWGIFRRNSEIVRLVRMDDDDLHYSPLGIAGLSPQWVVQRIMANFGMARDIGGLYVLAYHTQGLGSPEFLGVFPQLIDQLNANSTWIATADDIAQWWIARTHLAQSVEQQNARHMRLKISSHAARALDGVVLSVYPPCIFTKSQIETSEVHTPAAQIEPAMSSGRVRVRLGRLEPGKTYTYDLTLE